MTADSCTAPVASGAVTRLLGWLVTAAGRQAAHTPAVKIG
jgi:hypothetical protein